MTRIDNMRARANRDSTRQYYYKSLKTCSLVALKASRPMVPQIYLATAILVDTPRYNTLEVAALLGC
jgi:hypothetical protein